MGVCNSTRRSSGFTLIEIVISLAIIILAFGLITVKLNTERIIVENTADELTSAIRYAKQLTESGSTGVSFAIKKEQDGYYYTVSEMRNTTTEILKGKINNSVILFQKAVTEGHELDNQDTGYQASLQALEIKFSGSSASGTSILIKGKNTRSKYKITVIPTSARIHLYQYK